VRDDGEAAERAASPRALRPGELVTMDYAPPGSARWAPDGPLAPRPRRARR
jgi:hypothetical protein